MYALKKKEYISDIYPLLRTSLIPNRFCQSLGVYYNNAIPYMLVFNSNNKVLSPCAQKKLLKKQHFGQMQQKKNLDYFQ